MNIMHNKTERFITQLRHATHGDDVTERSIQMPANQPAQIR